MSEYETTPLAHVAALHHEWFLAYTAAGFTPWQAIQLIAAIFTSSQAEDEEGEKS